jgi:RNA polymerase sigma-70 factor (ECF subfamily)
MADDICTIVEDLFRRQAGQMVATLTRVLGAPHLALAEETVQDALVAALQRWPYRGVPDEPAAWLFQVARNRALDRLRHERVRADKATDVERARVVSELPEPEALLSSELPPLPDDQLGMMFMTCHPALAPESRVALTLKMVGGFSVGEIARALLAQDSAIAQRLVRAKRVLRDERVAFGPPGREDLAERLDSVLEVVYLIFTEGYAATSGDVLVREEISEEAIRLATLLARHAETGVPRSWALVSLLLLHAARFPARVSADGELFLLREQDRTRWDRGLIAAGMRALERASDGPDVSRYHLEAGIAACHAAAASWESTDWRRILELYDALLAATASPVVALNRAIALSRVEGPCAAIAALASIEGHPALARYHLRPAVLAELWREADDRDRAEACYREALRLAGPTPERRFLIARLEAL